VVATNLTTINVWANLQMSKRINYFCPLNKFAMKIICNVAGALIKTEIE